MCLQNYKKVYINKNPNHKYTPYELNNNDLDIAKYETKPIGCYY